MADGLAVVFQHTLAAPVSLEGRGLHSGRPVLMRVLPAEAEFGIRFRRTDLPGGPLIAAAAGNVVETVRCTVLEGEGGARVSTVEHLLSALRGLGVDNALIEVDGPEVPIADGSSALFCDLVQSAGLAAQAQPRRYQRLAKAVGVSNGQSCAVAIPADRFAVSVTLVNDHRHPALSDQFFELVVESAAYRQSVAAARTFGFLAEVEAMRARGLIQGASLENAVVLSDTEVLTPLRYPDELVRHKVLDLIGDLALLGPIHAHIIGIRTSHLLNNKLARAMADELVLV
ncbi:MAG: UDP-3-O-acyl-N-acetylglucosamine deacetylase [Symbiobacteriaceae bacterium]|jgi:UDP-3-O-acyl N-acetylglucosamine deacetylase|nr:UDP-3-O-acyl-N-acetylglucosamine deacetylase [Symbiobacteriaceae bacterium]